MDAKHLRIGNIVKDNRDGVVFPILDLSSFIGANGINGINSKYIEPIPLTIQILQRIAEFDGEIKVQVDYRSGAIKQTGKGVMAYYFSGEYIVHRIEYLHQLQNLYFILTDKELTINL